MLRFILPGLIWLSIVVTLSLAPNNELQDVSWSLFQFDKIAHIFVYALLVHAWLTGLKKQRTNVTLNNKAYPVVIGGALILGVIIEYIQGSFVTGRVFDVYDIVANSLGIFLGTISFYFLYRNYY